MARTPRFRALAAALAGVFAVACGSSTSPTGNFNAQASDQFASQIATTLQDNPALLSIGAVGSALTYGTAGAAAAFDRAAEPTVFDSSGLRLLTSDVIRLSTVGTQQLFPAGAIGKTFTYNSTTFQYEPSTQTGAPANGVRFILYEVDAGGAMVTPPVETGYLDLTPDSSSGGLEIKAVIGGAVYLDYVASGTVTAASTGTVSAVGFVDDGTTKLDFDFKVTGDSLSNVNLDYQVTADSTKNSVHLVLAKKATGEGNLNLTLADGTNTVILAAAGDSTSLSGQITYNGSPVVKITGTSNAPTFTRLDGGSLNQNDNAALVDLAVFIGQFDGLALVLLAPAFFVLGLQISG